MSLHAALKWPTALKGLCERSPKPGVHRGLSAASGVGVLGLAIENYDSGSFGFGHDWGLRMSVANRF